MLNALIFPLIPIMEINIDNVNKIPNSEGEIENMKLINNIIETKNKIGEIVIIKKRKGKIIFLNSLQCLNLNTSKFMYVD